MIMILVREDQTEIDSCERYKDGRTAIVYTTRCKPRHKMLWNDIRRFWQMYKLDWDDSLSTFVTLTKTIVLSTNKN